jgi:hypothetical protein
MSMPATRRPTLQAAGAAALAGAAAGLVSTGRGGAGEQTADGNNVVTYPIPDGAPTNGVFTVKVRPVGGTWETVGVYLTKLALIDPLTGRNQAQNSSMATFDFSGTVEVEVTLVRGGVEKARIRPDSYGITHDLVGSTVHFTLDRPRNVVVQVNDDIFNCLHLFTNPIETQRPDENDPNVIYFGPGLHTHPDNTLKVASGQTVYLAGGAVLTSSVVFKGVENARIIGRGVLLNTPNAGPIDIVNCENVTLDGIFMRNSDDCIALYTHRFDFYGDTRNITVKNCSLWADVAHPINMGGHGNPDPNAPEVLENLNFENIDILDHREPQVGYQGCISIVAGDGNIVRDVMFDNIRVENVRWGQLVHMRVSNNPKYNTTAGRAIESVYVKDLTYNGTTADTSLIIGLDADHLIKDVTFENLRINGRVIRDSGGKPSWYAASDAVPMFVNDHVRNLKFLTTEEAAAL